MPPGIAGSVPVVDVLKGQLLDQISDPESLLLPEAEWPEALPKATTQLKDPSEWRGLANEIWQRDLVLWLPIAAIFAPYGEPCVSGLFGVDKAKEVPGHPGLQQQRLICNLIPSNASFRVIRGDIDGLPFRLQ